MAGVSRALLLSIAVVAACEPLAPNAHPTLPSLGIAGQITLSDKGVLTFTLDEPCVPPQVSYFGQNINEVTGHCIRPAMFVHTPWGAVVRGVWPDNGHVTFTPDWSRTGLDPLDDHTADELAQPWRLVDAQWVPDPADTRRMVALIGDATDTQPVVVSGGPPPRLEVAALDVAGGAVEPGGATTLTVRVANKGEGDAYRVRVLTRSSVPSLHDKTLSFGHIAPGAEKTRSLTVHVPLTENAADTMLVLSFSEANGFVPHDVSRRVAIRPTVDAPVLAAACTIVDHDPARPELDAGEHIDVRCSVDNHGPSAAVVVVGVAVGRDPAVASQPKQIAANGSQVYDVPVVVPRGLALDSTVEIAAQASDLRYHRTADATIVGVVHRPKLCMPGQLTRAEYEAKIAELRKTLEAGDLTQAEFDRYDAELVGCLQ
jgi:hypothetical protein